MKKARKKYYYYLDIIRVFCCFAILLYHTGILKGGYLAVCSFFVLSGYLSFITTHQKENVTLKDYYKNKFLKLYLPLVITMLCTIPLVSIFKNIGWFQMKPEVTSNIFGYNNFWQLSANLDYFAHHINSPLMHLWYLSILIQFDLIFPFLYQGLQKLKEKFNSKIPFIVTTALASASAVSFCILTIKGNMMVAYYHTLTRIFSLLFGVALGSIHAYFKPKFAKKYKKKPWNKYVFYTYLVLMFILFILIDAKSIFFLPAMIVTTLLTCRMIDYATVITKPKKEIKKKEKGLQFLSNISYEIYLVQYPIIFIFQYINWNIYLEYFIILLFICMTAYLLHFMLSNEKQHNILRNILRLLLLVVLFIGAFQYMSAKDYTKEMKKLEEQLEQNEMMLEDKQKQYELSFKEQEDEFQNIMNELQNNEDKLKDVMENIQLVGVGDSVMLGAVPNLYEQFKNGYFDAKISRTAWVANEILQDLKNKNMLSGNIVLNLGTNGDCPEKCKNNIMDTIEDRELFWVNVTNDEDVHVNEGLLNLSKSHQNVHIIDWASISKDHPEYFVADKIHLTEAGRKAYTDAIYNTIYKFYYDKYQNQKNEAIKNHESALKKKISFYGNDILLNAFHDIDKLYPKAQFVMKKDYTYESLKQKLENTIKEKTLSYNVVFAFDNTSQFTLEQYQELVELCKGHKIYMISSSEETDKIISSLKNITIIDFYKEINDHSEYLMADKIHLTDEGNQALSNLIKKTIKG